MTVWMWPKTSDFNLYNNLLTESLYRAGMEIEDLKHGKFMLKIGKIKARDIIHIHWMHHAYQHRLLPLFAFKSLVFILTLLYLKAKRVRIVWTLHNLYPHNAKHKRMERFMRTLICRLCNHIVVASDSIKRQVMKEFQVPERKLSIVKHGHYLGAYKPEGTDFRKRYGIGKEADVYLFLGAIKPYKGVEELVAAFNAVKTERTYLIVAGKADSQMEAFFSGLADTKNIVMDTRFIPNEEVADLLGAADIMVLPYKQITTSGSAILALSFKKLLVMPDTPFIDDYFAENMVVKYNPHEENGLQRAMRTALHVKRMEMSLPYEEVLQELDWGNIAVKLKKVYQG
ncbi:glycosyltransferase [Paenibacillus beijingensis]|uniref:Glycosyl transferase family 1 n=1 Tax=Paenibacillus beijingensis TaxID=1126833 RepID=A0A0D5NLC1_9BACL|nr:glycosyltransferase [Paenibacillus beijingensis]AJY75713.1 glycosyl transferase family 1 [Paenibacillus beijingensis]